MKQTWCSDAEMEPSKYISAGLETRVLLKRLNPGSRRLFWKNQLIGLVNAFLSYESITSVLQNAKIVTK